MKILSKMMLAAVASVALAAPAFAWDFSASGSASATWKQETVAPATGDAATTMNFSSDGGVITIKSSNTDGDNKATLSYNVGWNDDDSNFDESFSLSGSKKVGKWTASASTSAHMQKDVTGAADQAPQTGDTSAAITVTDGTITHKLGDAGHLSTAEKAVNGPMDGAQDAEARVGGFNGYSLGYSLGDSGTVTVALDTHSGTTAAFLGEGSSGGDAAAGCGQNTTGFGFNYSGNVGADVSFTYASGSTTAKTADCTGDNKTNTASGNTMGLGVSAAAGPATIGFDYESSATTETVAKVEGGIAQSGYELSVTMPVADGTVGVNLSSQSTTTTTAGTAGDPAVTAGTELWYSTKVGAAGLDVGYGSSAVKDGATTTQLGVTMSLSF